jgi:3-dehydroquinate dehydratase
MRLTLDKLNRALRRQARESVVELKIFQTQSEAEASKLVQRLRNKVAGVLLVPGVWTSTGHLLRETLAIAKLPVALFHLTPDAGPWRFDHPSLLKDLAVLEDAGQDSAALEDFLDRFVTHLSS